MEKLTADDVVTGERMQDRCDVHVGTLQDHRYNPRFSGQTSRQFDVERGLPSSFPTKVSRVFCYGDVLLPHLGKIRTLLSSIENDFAVYVHNSDANVDERILALLSVANLRRLYVQNLAFDVPEDAVGRLQPLPIGIANSMWPHGDLGSWNRILSSPPRKSLGVYFGFGVSTNPVARRKCHDAMLRKGIAKAPHVPPGNGGYLRYLEALGSHRFAVCPEGNGLDTHRFWECLYLKTIPICLENPLTRHFSKTLPVLLLPDWDDLDMTRLDRFYEEADWGRHRSLSLREYEFCLKEETGEKMASSAEEPPFDVVVCLGPNDRVVIDVALSHNLRNVRGYRNFYVVSYDPSVRPNVPEEYRERVKVVDEKTFPFNKEQIAAFGTKERTGWYLQQLLKLYAGETIDGILDRYLVVDADTAFVEPVSFFEGDVPLYSSSDEYHAPYFEHMARLHPDLRRRDAASGICHHMVFCRDVLRRLFGSVEEHCGDAFWVSFMKNVSPQHIFSGASEYEIYYHYVLGAVGAVGDPSGRMRRRRLRSANRKDFNASGYQQISCHWYLKQDARPSIRIGRRERTTQKHRVSDRRAR